MLALVASLLLGFAAAGRVLPSPEIVNGYTLYWTETQIPDNIHSQTITAVLDHHDRENYRRDKDFEPRTYLLVQTDSFRYWRTLYGVDALRGGRESLNRYLSGRPKSRMWKRGRGMKRLELNEPRFVEEPASLPNPQQHEQERQQQWARQQQQVSPFQETLQNAASKVIGSVFGSSPLASPLQQVAADVFGSVFGSAQPKQHDSHIVSDLINHYNRLNEQQQEQVSQALFAEGLVSDAGGECDPTQFTHDELNRFRSILMRVSMAAPAPSGPRPKHRLTREEQQHLVQVAAEVAASRNNPSRIDYGLDSDDESPPPF